MKHARSLTLPIVLLSAAAAWPQAPITTFDAPGTGNLVTLPEQIMMNGTIVGYYNDANNVSHGFIRNKSGSFTTFDAPGAGSGSGQGTQALGMNQAGSITGYYFDANGVAHGFVRSRGGAFSTLDAPEAGSASGQGTNPLAINQAGTISGIYADSGGVYHGFVLPKGGAISSFDPVGSVNTFGDTLGIDLAGAISGGFLDAAGSFHGYLRNPNGAIDIFDAPGSSFTLPSMINLTGTICGATSDQNARPQWGLYAVRCSASLGHLGHCNQHGRCNHRVLQRRSPSVPRLRADGCWSDNHL